MKKPLSQKLAVVIAAATLFASGGLYHVLARDSAQLDAAADRVANVPQRIGDWVGHDEAADDAAFAQAGAKSYWIRTYVHQKSKASVLVILMCGRSGKMAVHTPEVCYGGAGYELHAATATWTLKNDDEKPAQLWSAHFVKKTGGVKHLRLYWGWNARGEWEAATAPRWQYWGEPFLYKLYVSRDTGASLPGSVQNDAAADFLKAFVPVMQQTLFAN